MIVREHIEFERGKDPKKAMKIGHEYRIRKMIEDAAMDLRGIPLQNAKWNYEYKRIRGYDAFIVHILEPEIARSYVGILPGLYVTGYEPNPEVVIEELENYLINPSWPFIHESFKRGVDPKKSLGIGFRKFLKSEFKKLYGWYRDQIEEYLSIEKYDIENDLWKTFISLTLVDILKHLGNGETIPNAFQDAYNFWENNLKSFEDYKAPPPSLVMNICRKILLDKYGLEWSSGNVFENIEFERGKDPKSSIDIGLKSSIKRLFKDLIRNQELTGIAYVEELEDPLREKFPMLLVRGPGSGLHRGIIRFFKDNGLDKYFDIYDVIIARHEDTFLYYPIKPGYEDLFRGMNLHWRTLDEGVDFQRGQDPKEVLGIGMPNPEIYIAMKDLAEKLGEEFEVINLHGDSKRRVPSIKSISLFNKRPTNIFIEKISSSATSDLRGRYDVREAQSGGSSGLGVFDSLDDAIKKVEEAIEKRRGIDESVSFERGQDPKTSMGLGLKRRLWDSMYHAFQNFDLDGDIDNFEIVGSIKETPTTTIHVLKNLTEYRGKMPYFYIIENGGILLPGNELYFTHDVDASTHARHQIEKYGYTYESANFERGKDPQDSMDIGLGATVKQRLKKMMEDFNRNNRETILSIWYNAPYGGDPNTNPSLTIKGGKRGEKEFYKKVAEYLKKYHFDKYLWFPGQDLYGSHSYPIAKYQIIKGVKHFRGTMIDA